MRKINLAFLLILVFQISFGQNWYYFTNFEDGNEIFTIDTSLSNIWQIGQPQKDLLDSAFSYPNAIITDTLNAYPSNNISTFHYTHYPLYGEREVNLIILEFVHRFDMDSSSYGIIEGSIDGINWINLVNSDENFGFFCCHYFYNTNEWIDSITITGTSNGWIKSSIEKDFWEYQEVDSIILRFTFISDSLITNQDGWIIDNFYIEEYHAGSVNEFEGLRNFATVFPNPITELTIIEFENRNSDKYSLKLCNIQGETIYMTDNIRTNRFALKDIELENGIYFYTIESNRTLKGIGKIIK